MTRFFVPAEQIRDRTICLVGSDRHHLVRVLRKKTGDEVTVLNGKGEEYIGRIAAIDSESVTISIEYENDRPAEPRLKITLVQSLPKAGKFELVLQKNTEIGVSAFWPVVTERSAVRFEQRGETAKMARWGKIIQEAAEQSGRKILPELEPIKSWNEMLACLKPGLVLLPWEGEKEKSLKQLLEETGPGLESVTVLIGPEGGFSLAEVEEARGLGAIPVTLGPRILRTETAGLVVATVLLYHFGDLG